MKRNAQVLAWVAMLGVFCVFVAPSTDLPDTVKLAQAVFAVAQVALLLLPPAVSMEPSFVVPQADAHADLVTRNHALRI